MQDAQASDSIDEALQLLHINAFLRQPMRKLKGIQLQREGSCVTLKLLSPVWFFALSERYDLGGSVSHLPRRDLRRGELASGLKRGACSQPTLPLFRPGWARAAPAAADVACANTCLGLPSLKVRPGRIQSRVPVSLRFNP